MPSEGTRTGHGWRGYVPGVALGVLGLAVLLHVAHTGLGLGSPQHDYLIEEWIYDFVTMSSALVVLTAAVVRREGRLAWALVGVGLLAWASADLYWSISLNHMDDPPFPSGADVLYLAGYAFVLGGVVTLVRMRVKSMSAVVWTDVAIGSLCVAAIGTSVLMDFVLENTSGSALEIAVA